MQKKLSICLSVYYFIVSGLVMLPARTYAKLQRDPEGHSLVDDLGLPNTFLPTTVINFVKWALGFLGLVSVIMLIYGGYQYLTAGGNEESVEKAKKIIKNALVGLVIVLLSYAIALFVFTLVQDEFKTLP